MTRCGPLSLAPTRRDQGLRLPEPYHTEYDQFALAPLAVRLDRGSAQMEPNYSKPLNMPLTPEQRASGKTDGQLTPADWEVQDYKLIAIHSNLGVAVHEYRVPASVRARIHGRGHPFHRRPRSRTPLGGTKTVGESR